MSCTETIGADMGRDQMGSAGKKRGRWVVRVRGEQIGRERTCIQGRAVRMGQYGSTGPTAGGVGMSARAHH